MTPLDEMYGIGANVFDICKSYERYDATPICGTCGEPVNPFAAVHYVNPADDMDECWYHLMCIEPEDTPC